MLRTHVLCYDKIEDTSLHDEDCVATLGPGLSFTEDPRRYRPASPERFQIREATQVATSS